MEGSDGAPEQSLLLRSGPVVHRISVAILQDKRVKQQKKFQGMVWPDACSR